NKDNHLDIVVANYGSHSIEILFGDGNGYFKDPIEISLGSSRPIVLAVGNLNKVDQLDIAVVNAGTLTVTLLMGHSDGSFQIEATYDMGYDSIPYSLTISDFNNDQQNDIIVINYGTNDFTILFANDDETFTSKRYSIEKGSHPCSIDSGDFNMDGIEDIAIGNCGSGNIAIFLGSGDETFVNLNVLSTGVNFQPQFIRVTDFNNDTYLDIVAVDSMNGELNIFNGRGNGNFSLITTYSSGLNSYPCSFSIADFDNDNILDIVITNNGTNSITILTKYIMYPNTSQTVYSTGESSSPIYVSVGDFNHDNYLDIVVANSESNNIGIFINLGNGTFDSEQLYNTSSLPQEQLIAIGDFNNDNHLDIVVVMTNAMEIMILFGYNNGTFKYGNIFSTGTDSPPDSLTIGLLNNDSYLDFIITTSTSHNIGIFLGYGDGNFTEVILYQTDKSFSPNGVNIGDFNNDNISDVLITDFDHGGITILLGYSNGSFMNSIFISTENDNPAAVTIGDINNDSRLDIVYTSITTSIVGVLLGYGNGSFGSIIRYSTDYGSYPTSVSLVDFNNDTFIDILVSNLYDYNIGLFMGLGNGSFAPQKVLPAGFGLFPTTLAIADFNNDKQPDIVFSDIISNYISVFLVYYDAGFTKEISYTTGSGSHPYSIGVSDFNNDNQLDIVVANSGNDQIELLFGYNNGTFKNKVTYSTGLNSRPEFVTIADFNQDKQQDIIVANIMNDAVNIFLGFGNGTFNTPTTYSTGSGSRPVAIATSDFNNDNQTDFVVSNQGTNEIAVFIAFNYVTFTNYTVYIPDSYPSASYVVAGDFNSDGQQDVVTVDTSNAKMIVFLGYGNRTFAKPILYSTGPSSSPSSIALGDFNMDNQLDIVVTNSDANNIGVFFGYGNGSFTAQVIYSTGNLSSPGSIATGDINKDNITDIVVANNGKNNIGIFFGYGNGTFAKQVLYLMPNGSSPVCVSVADINNDQNQDIIVANMDTDNIIILWGYHNGTFIKTPLSLDKGSAPSSVTTGDLNKDGLVDIAIANRMSEIILVYFGNGSGSFSTGSSYTTGIEITFQSISIHDINNDTNLDIVLTGLGEDTGIIIILFGFGNGNFTIPTVYSTGSYSSPTSVAIRDFDNDGRIDLVVNNYLKGSLFFMFQFRYDQFVRPWFFSTGDASYPSSVAVRDFNNDQYIDIAVANSGTNNIGIYLGLGTGLFVNQRIYSTGDNSYPRSIIIDNFNNNERLDIAVANFNGNNICILFDYENGSFSFITSYSTGILSAPSSITSAYLNKDNYLDIIVTLFGTNKILVFYGLNNGTFQEAKSYALEYNARPQSIIIGDIDNNSLLDIIVANTATDYVEILLQICQS
ncbi:unnamed protein product, partial [Adineta steineri]